MKTTKKAVAITLVCILCLSLCACGARRQDVIGTWTDTYEFSGDTFSVTLVLEENGHYSIVTYQNGSLFNTFEGEWKMDGGDVCCITEEGSRTYEYAKGKLVNGSQTLTKQ